MATIETRDESQTRDTALGVRIDNLETAVEGKINKTYVDGQVHELQLQIDCKQESGEYVTLENGKISDSKISDKFKNVVVCNTTNDLPDVGNEYTLYVCKDTCYLYFWCQDKYKLLTRPIVFGETEGTCYDGLRGKTLENGLEAHIADKDNPHGTTPAKIGAVSTKGVNETDSSWSLTMNSKSVLNSDKLIIAKRIWLNPNERSIEIVPESGISYFVGSNGHKNFIAQVGFTGFRLESEIALNEGSTTYGVGFIQNGGKKYLLPNNPSGGRIALLSDLTGFSVPEGLERLDTFDVEGATDMEVRTALRNCINFINGMFFPQE